MKCYVNEDSLRAFYPRITEYLGSSRVDFSLQIQEAFRQTIDALRAQGIKARQIGRPLDLLRAAGTDTKVETLTQATQTASADFPYIEAIDGFNRCVISVSTIDLADGSESYSFALEGSNDLDRDPANPPTNWIVLGGLKIPASGDHSFTFTDEFRYYRLRLTVSGTTPQLIFTACLVETAIDRVVIYKTLQLVMRDFSVQDGDVFDKRAREAGTAFDNAISSLVLALDLDEDNLPTEDEKRQTGGAEIWR